MILKEYNFIFKLRKVAFAFILSVFYFNTAYASQTPMLDFYEEKTRNPSDYSISQIWNFSNEELEEHHDFIQYLFPTKEQSQYASASTAITHQEIFLFKSNPVLMQKYKKSLEIMSSFYGLRYDKNKHSFSFAHNHRDRFRQWITPGNHNFLRLTRILKSLHLMELSTEAISLFNCLNSIYDYGANAATIGEKTYSYWAQAAFPQ